MKHLQNSKGFTLIELMIVVVIIGILAAIAIPRFTSFGDDARISEGEQLLRSVHTHQEMFRARYGTYAADWQDEGAERGLESIGWDPGEDGTHPVSNFFEDWNITADLNTYTVCATGNFGDEPLMCIDESGRITVDGEDPFDET